MSGIDEPPCSPLRPFQMQVVSRASRRLAAAATSRRPRPWLGLVGVALAATAAPLADGAWLLPPLALCAWWWCPTEWRWTWLLPLLSAVVGVLWVTVGTALIAVLPLPIAGLWWVAIAAGLAALGALLRARMSDAEGEQ
jgi:hypothetical protein